MTDRITRTDKAYIGRWTRAYRKGKPTAEITREWLADLERPQPPAPPASEFNPGTTCSFTSFPSLILAEEVLGARPPRIYVLNK